MQVIPLSFKDLENINRLYKTLVVGFEIQEVNRMDKEAGIYEENK